MFDENMKIEQADIEHLAISLQNSEHLDFNMRGDCIDRIFKNGEFVEERVGHNLVVTSFLTLITYMLKQSSGGIKYWAIGSGNSSWDSNMPSPVSTETSLTNEIGRVSIPSSEITYLTVGGSTSPSPTNIIQIKHTFGNDVCNGEWREFGIFGADATSTANSGIMMNKRHHPVLTKTSDMSVERTMRFTLSLT